MLTSDEINTLISQIYADQSYEFLDLIKKRQSSLLSNEEILKREIIHISCPQCGSENFYRNGHTKTGKQKYTPIIHESKNKKNGSYLGHNHVI